MLFGHKHIEQLHILSEKSVHKKMNKIEIVLMKFSDWQNILGYCKILVSPKLERVFLFR